MVQLSGLVLLGLFAGAAAVEVTPVEKVINLVAGLKKEVEDEGKAEASAYESFACFCKDTSNKKSDSVKKGNDNINMLSADIADKTQEKKDDSTELGERKANQEKLSRELDETNVRCAKEKAEYEAENADLSKAISSLNSAIKAMKTTGGASLIAIQSVVKTLSTVKTSSNAQKLVASLLQQKVDPSDPEYGYHSGDIVSLCEDLLGDFKGNKKDLDTEWSKTDTACKATKASLKKEMKSNKSAMGKLDQKIERLAKEIAEHREDLVEAEGDLKDDELYLKDLTQRCEDRANDYDQRSAQRGDELNALTQALNILSGDVKGADEDANQRAALLEVKKAPVVAATKPVSFLQGSLVKEHAQHFLARVDNSLELEAKKNKALAMLRVEGRRIGSVTIAALTVRSAADPFKKVKGLIQKLIERLLTESQAEATKKGFCDTALASAESERNSRFEEANDLSRKVAGLEAKEDALSEEIEVLTKDIKNEKADLKEASEDRDTEKKENLKTIATAKDGHEAVTNALQLLKSFYSQAAKAAALIQASPVDEDTAGPGFSGSYKGKQGGMKAVFSLLEVIQSDFDRTIRSTEKAEEKAHREHVAFSQASESSIASKDTKKELDTQDLKTTRTNIEQSMNNMQENVDLLDKALEELEELKPTCIDTGMSYKERVAKREEEITALKNALTILAP